MHRYFLFHKPFEVLCQFSRSGNKRTLKEFGFPPQVYPIGRLDYDSEGLLILSDDKTIVNRLLSPSKGHERGYWVQVEGHLSSEGIENLRRGVSLKDGPALPAIVRILEGFEPPFPRTPPIRQRKTIPTSWIELHLTEGKNRQVRRMTAAIGCPTLRLIRYKIRNLGIDGLAPGDFREISQEDIWR